MARPQRTRDRRFPQARKVVPAEVRGILGRTEFKQALRGATDAEIRRENAILVARWEAQIASARAELKGATVALTPRQVAAISGEWYRAEVASWEDQHQPSDAWTASANALAEQDGPGDYEMREARDAIRDQGIAADAASLARLADAIYRHRIGAFELLARRADGDWSPDARLATLPEPGALPAQSAPAAAAPTASLSFSALVDRWAAEAQPPKKSLEKAHATFASLAKSCQHEDARRITVAEVRTWKEQRIAAGRSIKTVSDNIAACRATLNWAMRNGLVEGANPFSGMAPRLPKHGQAARDPYSDEDARMIFAAARRETGWRRWLPFVLAYTGARIEEAAEARRRDVRQESGVWVLDIVPTGGRRLKTAHSQRMVPLHPALADEGFLSYVAALPADGPLFPDIRPGRYGSRGSTASKAHSRWVRETVGITDRRKAPAHSWRHRLEDQLRIARVPIEAQDAITGHDNPRNAGAGYGRGFRGMPDEVLKELAKVPRIALAL